MLIHPNPDDLVRSHEERVAKLRREIHLAPIHKSDSRPVRRWVGRQLVRVGVRLAADPSLRPARSL